MGGPLRVVRSRATHSAVSDVSNCTLAHPDGEPEDTNEACGDAIDNDHDGVADCDDPDCSAQEVCRNAGSFFDADGDDYTTADGDCDDNDPAINPGASEVCDNAVDDNCDGAVDEGCGNGVEVGEPVCGDGITQPDNGEECDDGGATALCDASCRDVTDFISV